ncbi:MAG TPA: AIM24 family protein [Candidatus Baltobacteraceae bacterium]|nr:AIM24 family protein [Candidatus Baltobacteraceae bacterium]
MSTGPAPVLKATTAQAETFAGVTYHLDGELVPVLTVELSGVSVYFEHHVLLWKDTQTQIGIKQLAGAFKRVMSGMPIFMTEAHGPGRIAFSRDGAGHVFGIHLKQGQSLDVREHQFLAATDQLDYTFARVKGVANMLMGGTGFFIDTFTAHTGDGVLWLHGFGNVFEVFLNVGDQIDIEPGGWIYKDRSVQMETQFQKLATGMFASAGQLVWNRFRGPGRVGLQSMYIHFATAE